MDKLRLLISVALLFAFAAVPASSEAQEDSVRVYATSAFGFGGQLAAEPEDDDAPEPDDEDLIPTLGFALGAEVPVHTYFTLGAELGMAWWNTEDRADPELGDEFDRHRQLDVLARPKLRFAPVSSLELYGVVPIGFSYFIPSGDSDASVLGVDIDAEGGPGFAVGVGAGATLFLLDHVGLTVEAGYLFRRFRGSLGDSLTGRESEFAMRFGQAQLRAGLTVAF